LIKIIFQFNIPIMIKFQNLLKRERKRILITTYSIDPGK